MKARNGFVSNSSSSSFVIYLEDITAKQLQMIIDHEDIAKEMGLGNAEDYWHIITDKHVVAGDTFMDNFDMRTYLTEVVRVPENLIKWERD